MTRGLHAPGIKRESGENPEQTRYCKVHTKTFGDFDIHWSVTAGKDAGSPDKSGDLPEIQVSLIPRTGFHDRTQTHIITRRLLRMSIIPERCRRSDQKDPA